MGITIFWSAIALFYLVLTIVTSRALRNLHNDLSALYDHSPSGIFTKKGEVISVETTLFKALKAILITDIVGFSLAVAAAIGTLIFR